MKIEKFRYNFNKCFLLLKQNKRKVDFIYSYRENTKSIKKKFYLKFNQFKSNFDFNSSSN